MASLILGANGQPIETKPPMDTVVNQWANDSLGYDAFIKVLPNPDANLTSPPAVAKGAKIYDEMIDYDGQVGAVTQTRRLALQGLEWEVIADEGASQDIADAVGMELQRLGMRNLLGLVTDAVLRGISVAELEYGIDEDTGRWTVVNVWPSEPWRFAFSSEDGSLRYIRDAGLKPEGVPVPRDKFIVPTYGRRYAKDVYGRGVLLSAFWAWWFKKNTIRFWCEFNERFAQPLVVGRSPVAADEKDLQQFKKVLQTIRQKMSIKLPEGFDLAFMEAERRGTVETYERAIATFDALIAKAVLGQTLTTEQGESGSYSLGQVHNQVRHDILEADAEFAMEVIGRELIRPICWYGWGLKKNFPRLWINHRLAEITKEDAERFAVLVNGVGLKIAASTVYEQQGVPIPEGVEDYILEKPEPAPVPRLPQLPPMAAAEMSASGPHKLAASGLVRIAAKNEAIVEGWEQRLTVRAVKVFEVVTKSITEIVNSASDFKEAKKRILGRKQIPAGAQDILGDSLFVGYLGGLWAVAMEGDEQGVDVFAARGDGVRFASRKRLPPIEPEAAIEFFKGKNVLTPVEFAKLKKATHAQAFTMVKEANAEILGTIADSIDRGLRDGVVYRDWAKNISAVYDAAGVTRQSPHYLQLVFRNNTHTAYSVGRYRQATAPGMDDFFVYYTYLTADDADVGEDHAPWHEFTARRDDSIWDSIWPPNRHNCRCTTITLTEEYARELGYGPSAEPPPVEGKPFPASGFEGNPAKQAGYAARIFGEVPF